MSGSHLTGSCLCGAVTYVLHAEPVWAHACHCSRCRKSRGSAFAVNLFVPLDALEFDQGVEHVVSFAPKDAERFQTAFCDTCGSKLPFPNPSRGLAVVPMGSLDGDPPHGPKAHIYVDSKAPWYEITDALPRHPGELGSGETG